MGKYSQYKLCYLLAKYYYDKRLSPPDIRNKIFEWAKQNNYWISENINNIIQRVVADDKPLVGDINIYVSDDEIESIRCRFDTFSARIVALAILCYAKCSADKNGFVRIPQQDIAAWVGLSRNYVSRTTIKELLTFEYILPVDKYQKKRFAKVQSSYIYLSKVYRMNVPFGATDGVHFDGGDIIAFYYKIFS